MEFIHVFTRGVDKRDIFMDDNDRLHFMDNLYRLNNIVNTTYPRRIISPETQMAGPLVEIHAFCLMDNHYHMLLLPRAEKSIPKFMAKVNIAYAKYFNKKYDRSGALFASRYKRVEIEEESHFNYILYYIHLNPLDLMPPNNSGEVDLEKAEQFLELYPWSSHADYLGDDRFKSLLTKNVFEEFIDGEKHYREETRRLIIKKYSTSQVADLRS